MSNLKTILPLEEVARKIEACARKSDEHMISAAMLVGEARNRVEAGEAGKVTWYEWGLKNIKLSPSRLYELQCIAEADNPAAEIERLRRLIRERVKKHREKKSAEKRAMEEERKDLIAWAKKAPIEEVRRMLRQVGSQAGGAPTVLIETRPTQGRKQAA